jgi:hypothetical protein
MNATAQKTKMRFGCGKTKRHDFTEAARHASFAARKLNAISPFVATCAAHAALLLATLTPQPPALTSLAPWQTLAWHHAGGGGMHHNAD